MSSRSTSAATKKSPAAAVTPETLVVVRRHWNDWVSGEVKYQDLRDFHWRDSSGGVGQRSPRPMLYARMFCNALISGSVSHSCEHGPPPHDILVCITKSDNRKIFPALDLLSNRT
jgi:hypothetical protein